jgi:hypothetical protein
MPDGAAPDWTCSRCEVTVSWVADVERPEIPSSWIEERGQLYCLSCRRDLAEESGLDALPEGATAQQRQQTKAQARVEFELRRVPEREDNRIAKSCNTSVIAVRRARARLGMRAQSPS